MIHVRKNIQRPSKEIIEAFKGYASATIHEASGRKGYISSRIKPIAKGIKVCGPAFTVQCPAGDNMMLHKALELAQPGDVIIATVGGAEEYGYWGDLMSVSAVSRKLGGLCIEGCIRDSEDIIQLGFPVFSTGLCIRGTGKGTLGLINYVTVFGGQSVNPGDLIVGDDDGLVLIRREECEEVLQKTINRVNAEVKKAEVLATGISSVEYNGLGPKFAEAGLVEED
jgi:4-hydroxy-4-methyl-2-oxoglutarate aldolase